MKRSAATSTVCSLAESKSGYTSTLSASTIYFNYFVRRDTFSPSIPRGIVRSSQDVQPPLSGVPVLGAKAGSTGSMSIER